MKELIVWTYPMLASLIFMTNAKEIEIFADNCTTIEKDGERKTCFNIEYSSGFHVPSGGEDPLFYEPTTKNINGTLINNLNFNGTGNCFEIHYHMKGKNDETWNKKNWPWNTAKSGIQSEIIPEFTPTNKCQRILLWGSISYRRCNTFDNLESHNFPHQRTIIPIYEWLESMVRDDFYPILDFNNSKIPSIAWGDASKFGCDSEKIQTKVDITYKMEPIEKYKDRHINDNGTTTNEKHSKFNENVELFSTQEYPDLNLNEQEQCYDWKINITVNFTFYNAKNVSYGTTPVEPFIRKLIKKRIVGKLTSTDVKTMENTTHIEIVKEDGSELECLNTTVEVTIWTGGVYKSTRKQVKFSSKTKAYVDLGTVMDTKCQEAVVFLADDDIPEIYHIGSSFPTLTALNKTGSNTIVLHLENEQFDNCEDITFRMICSHINNSTINVTKREDTEENNIKTDQIITKIGPDNQNVMTYKSKTGIFTIPYLINLDCWADAFIQDPDKTDEAINDIRPAELHIRGGEIEVEPKHGKSNITIAAILITLAVVMVIGLATMMMSATKGKKDNNLKRKSIQSFKKGKYPHIIVNKDDNTEEGHKQDEKLLKSLTDLVEIQDEVVEEFNKIETYSQKLEAKETTNNADSTENVSRNRYKDMVPYDSNIVWLKNKTGQPPSDYINASHIKFDGMTQTFLAVQAPKPNMFGPFWQMAWEQDVSVIVMITDLVEGGKMKAHKYWPDKDETEMKWPDVDLEAKYEKHSFSGTFYQRSLVLTNNKGEMKKIEQLQTMEWIDMTAPKNTKILLDLLYKSEELIEESPGSILVHCSAGVGRTGTYIGLYKLVNDYNDDNVRELDFYQTVLDMRAQRMKMVQKPLQYHYMIKCLADYIARETSDYA